MDMETLQEIITNAEAFSNNGEDWNQDFDSILDDFAEHANAGDLVTFHVGNVKRFKHSDFMHPGALDELVEEFQEQAYERVGEIAEIYLEHLANDETREKFNELVCNFIQEQAGDVNIYQVEGEKEVVAIWDGENLQDYQINKPDGITDEDIKNLRHMLGANESPSKWGYRNRFCSGESDIPSMRRLESAGLVREVKNAVTCGPLFVATVEGCKVLQFTQAMIDYAME